MFKHDLGSKAQSKITGFKGIITSRSEHVNGCNRYWLEPRVDKKGNAQQGYWFDEEELEILEKPKVNKTNPDRGGFPSTIK